MRWLLFAFLLSAAQAETVTNLPGLIVRGGENKIVEATGHVANTDGVLEFIAVEKAGRDYESLFTLDCRPSALKFALLLIGCETNDPVRIEVEWAGKRIPVEQLLLDRHTKKSPPALPWIFTGSYFTKSVLDGREVFMADEEQAFVALWWQPSALINLRQDFGNPYHSEAQGFEANPKALPPKDTPVKLIFRKQ
jgi:hypothetical protein